MPCTKTQSGGGDCASKPDFCLWGCRIVANTSAFQAEDAGSIPVIPSKFHRSAFLEARAVSAFWGRGWRLVAGSAGYPDPKGPSLKVLLRVPAVAWQGFMVPLPQKGAKRMGPNQRDHFVPRRVLPLRQTLSAINRRELHTSFTPLQARKKRLKASKLWMHSWHKLRPNNLGKLA